MIGGERSRDPVLICDWSGSERADDSPRLHAAGDVPQPDRGGHQPPGELWLVEAGHVTPVLTSDWSGRQLGAGGDAGLRDPRGHGGGARPGGRLHHPRHER